MWTVQRETLSERALRFAVLRDAKPATVGDAIRGWQADESFRRAFNGWLADAPFAAYRWETPGVVAASAARPFEFVLLDDPGLARPPDPDAFAEHFGSAGEPVVSFANLGRDAILVVPRALGDPSAYGHLAAFARHAPAAQRSALWQRVGVALAGRLGAKPVWLSTAGAGVPWLHVRLDDRPKYYGWEGYRKVMG
ncbi:MAG: hypothetical protein KF873_06375 [Gemmataceae bacterium]|nr:hypothetical protein [Gemmataceae bacterium]